MARSLNHYSDSSDTDSNVTLPFRLLPTVGLEYKYKLKDKNLFLYGSLVDTYESTAIKYSYFKFPPDRGLHVRGGGISGKNLALQTGFSRNFLSTRKFSFNVTMGYGLRFILKNFPGSLGLGCEDTCFLPLAGFEYRIKGNFHSSLFAIVNIDLWKDKKNQQGLKLNLTYNYGLHTIYRTYSYLYIGSGGVEKEILLDYKGSYFGAGLTYTRSTYSTKFRDLFKFKKKI